MIDLSSLIGRMDIYLLDQVLRGNIVEGQRIFEAGTGAGRNLVYFMRAGFELAGIDADPEAIGRVRKLAARLAPELPESNFRSESVEDCSFEDGWADVLISSAVLHFADSHQHFDEMLRGSWRLLRTNGLFFCRLASTIGMSIERFDPLVDGRFRVPDGSTRYLVDEEQLMRLTGELGGALVDPLKTTVVQDQRCMTTWVMRKANRAAPDLNA